MSYDSKPSLYACSILSTSFRSSSIGISINSSIARCAGDALIVMSACVIT